MTPLVVLLAACHSSDRDPSDLGLPPPGQTFVPGNRTVDGDVTTTTVPPAGPCTPLAPLAVNEVSAANDTLVVDDEGDSVDWIELFNPGPDPVDLAGWTLTDDDDEPRKWTLPARTLSPGEFLLVYASDKGPDEPMALWDTRIDQGDEWRWLGVTATPDPEWYLPDFDDAGWERGPSGFGHGDGDDATLVPDDVHTVYARTTFQLSAAELDDVGALLFHADYDDGFVAYLNGVEVARAGIGLSGLPPAWDELAKDGVDAALINGGQPAFFDLRDAISLLVEGENTLAVEVHDYKTTSTDLTIIPFLTLGFTDPHGGAPSAVLDLSRVDLHTSFSLSADGEPVGLYDPAACLVSELSPGQMFTDQSFGRQPDGGASLGYFLEPTPGAPNVTESRPGFAATPTFDPPPGVHPGGALVSVLSAPTARVYVAWDGYEPTEEDPPYTGPLPTGDEGEAVVIRARAFQDDLWPSRIATGTYVLREPGDLPVVSLVTDPVNLWDEQVGIYVYGPEDYRTETPYYGANFWEEWEVPVHFAQWEPDGSSAFAVDGGLEIMGGTSRANEQKGLLVKLRSGYGDPVVPYPVFPQLPYTEYERVVLRAGGTDWHGCGIDGCGEGALLRDSLMHAIAADTGVDQMAYRSVQVYLNGEFWGLYDQREKPDDEWILQHHGYDDDEIDLLQQEGVPLRGDGVHWQATMAYLRSHDLSDPAVWAHVQTLIDTDELATWLALEVFYANHDWPGNNLKYWRPREPGGRWRWLLYDLDFGLGRFHRKPDVDTLGHALDDTQTSWPNPAWSTELFRLMFTSPEFKVHFANRYADLMNTVLHPDHTRPWLDQLAGDLAADIPRQVQRWGSWTDGTVTHELPDGLWDEEVLWIDEWLGARAEPARQHVVTHLGFEGTWTLDLDVSPPGAGSFELTTVEVDAPFSGVYFRGAPVTITAVPAPGYTFDGWSDPTVGGSATIVLDPDAPVSLVARFQ